MNYWRLTVFANTVFEYDVYYKNPLNISHRNVAMEAVADGDLLATHYDKADQIDKISEEEYHIYMWD